MPHSQWQKYRFIRAGILNLHQFPTVMRQKNLFGFFLFYTGSIRMKREMYFHTIARFHFSFGDNESGRWSFDQPVKP